MIEGRGVAGKDQLSKHHNRGEGGGGEGRYRKISVNEIEIQLDRERVGGIKTDRNVQEREK